MVRSEERLIQIPSLNEETFALECIKVWLKKQQHLPAVSDEEILLFLHHRRYSIEKTKKMIDAYFSLRTHIPEIFSNRDTTKHFMKCLDIFACVFLPEKTSNDEIIMLHKLFKPDVNVLDMMDALKLEMLIVDIVLSDRGRVGGTQIIFDCTDASLMHMLKFSAHFAIIKKIFTFAKVALPINIMGVHFINCNALTDQISMFLKPLLKKDLSGSIHFYGSNEKDLIKFHEFIPKKICPLDYGGTAPSVAQLNEQNKLLLQNKIDFIEDLDKRKVNESLRPAESKHPNSLYGVEGSFKRLELD